MLLVGYVRWDDISNSGAVQLSGSAWSFRSPLLPPWLWASPGSLISSQSTEMIDARHLDTSKVDSLGANSIHDFIFL